MIHQVSVNSARLAVRQWGAGPGSIVGNSHAEGLRSTQHWPAPRQCRLNANWTP